MNLRALVYMNPVVFDKISKKSLYEKDSGFLWAKQLIDSHPFWRFTVLVPKGFDQSFFSTIANVECWEYDYATNAQQNRYHFNKNIISRILPYSTDIDIVINMQPEVSENLRVFFLNQRRERPIIINYFHWLDSMENEGYAKELSGFIWRQVEGVNAADMSMFHTEGSRQQVEKMREKHNLPQSDYNYDYFHPLPTWFGEVEFPLPDKKIILFNHRLNNTTGWQEVLKIFQEMNRDDAVLWFTDDQNTRGIKKLKDIKGVIVKHVPFESYGYLLRNSWVSVANMDKYVTWNMAVLDSLMYGTPVISNDKHSIMSELGCVTTDNLKHTLEAYLQNIKVKSSIPHGIGNPDELWKQEQSTLYSWVEHTIKDRVKDKTPKKYDMVKKLIEDMGKVTKRDMVNKYWSFHANSNFQTIRWKLLSEGIVDAGVRNYKDPGTLYQMEESK